MKHLRAAGILALSVALGGCAGSRFAEDLDAAFAVRAAVADATVSAKTVFAAAAVFRGSEYLAANYLELRRCNGSNGPVCREPSATPIIKGAVRSGRIARDALKAQLRAACAAEFAAGVECSKGIPIGSYNTLVAAARTIKDAASAYQLATSQ